MILSDSQENALMHGKNLPRLLNSDEIILQVLKESNNYFESKNEISSKVNRIIWILRSMEDLLPQTVESFWSGHMLPMIEASYELESSVQLCKFGFYKHALIALRNTLELGLLSIYWDLEDKSYVEIQEWLHSHKPTPFKKDVIAKLKTNQHIKTFDDKHNFFNEVNSLFGELSNFAHTRGKDHSNIDLSNSNVNSFNEKSLLKCIDFLPKVVKIVVIIHILKYPIAFQHTPFDQKFGLNIPAGGYLEPDQSKTIKKFLDEDVLKTLQAISDSDHIAVEKAKWINRQPDITKEEMQKQVDKFNREHSL